MLTTFEELGHKPYSHSVPSLGIGHITACKKCHCWIGSAMASMPCGDPIGKDVLKVPVLRKGQHAYDYVWQGKTIGYEVRD